MPGVRRSMLGAPAAWASARAGHNVGPRWSLKFIEYPADGPDARVASHCFASGTCRVGVWRAER